MWEIDALMQISSVITFKIVIVNVGIPSGTRRGLHVLCRNSIGGSWIIIDVDLEVCVKLDKGRL